MKTSLLALVAVLLIAATSGASASSQEKMLADCTAALAAGDRAAMFGIVATFIAPADIDVDHQIKIGACLSEGFGERWSYVPEMKLFQGAAVADQFASKAAAEAANRAAVAAREAEDRAAVAAREKAEMRAQQEKAAAERRRRDEVIAATAAACDALYAKDRIAALTNAVCSPIFMATGLPY